LLTVLLFEDVEHGQYLSVVGNQYLTDHVTGGYEVLEYFQNDTQSQVIACAEGI